MPTEDLRSRASLKMWLMCKVYPSITVDPIQRIAMGSHLISTALNDVRSEASFNRGM